MVLHQQVVVSPFVGVAERAPEVRSNEALIVERLSMLSTAEAVRSMTFFFSNFLKFQER